VTDTPERHGAQIRSLSAKIEEERSR
jgi:hypothetical protein